MPDFLSDFEWRIDTKGYRLERLHSLKGLCSGLSSLIPHDADLSTKPLWVVRRNGGRFRDYRPLANFDMLYSHFARIKTSEELLDFIKKFGSLTKDGDFPSCGNLVSYLLPHARAFRAWLNGKGDLRGEYFTQLEASLKPDVSGSLHLQLVPRDLLSGLWLQLGLKLSGEKKISTCLHCGNWFEAGPGTGRRADAKFCSDEHRIEFNSHKRTKEQP